MPTRLNATLKFAFFYIPAKMLRGRFCAKCDERAIEFVRRALPGFYAALYFGDLDDERERALSWQSAAGVAVYKSLAKGGRSCPHSDSCLVEIR